MVVEFEEVKYGMLMMVLCDREGRGYDVWITFGSVHEVRAFRERKKRSLWFRRLLIIVCTLLNLYNLHLTLSYIFHSLIGLFE